ncbi:MULTISPECIES: FadR/GntR family transcriptional regulator [unclassified Chelatococcus]|uniref:FadR/GntR family transcriptional regulator n=1 Tax=unclassified Chelatococcus TaxID=2638111 RepID=UPI001BD04400|nr:MULTISPECIES: FadR/GntR family transcriptional regulator [unclassified Chelatococcus]MBS7701617.1 FadR family transcriptional regulator [Chelatococcus sp. YT9]MBX3559687.1 FadR family transcriptional regulator [Chelatococcus sp.]
MVDVQPDGHFHNFAAAKKRKLSDEIYNQLIQQISASEYKAGDRLPTEGQLAAAFRVSRPVVREALQRLQEDAIISSRRGAGTFVNRLPPSEIGAGPAPVNLALYMRTFEVRFCIEPEISRLAARRRTNASLASLSSALAKLEASLTQGSDSAEADFNFHLQIAQATQNELFTQYLLALKHHMISSISIMTRITRIRPRERSAKVFREHQDIFDAILARDEDGARTCMMYHLWQVRGRITDASR